MKLLSCLLVLAFPLLALALEEQPHDASPPRQLVESVVEAPAGEDANQNAILEIEQVQVKDEGDKPKSHKGSKVLYYIVNKRGTNYSQKWGQIAKKRNPLSLATIKELSQAFDEVKSTPKLKVFILKVILELFEGTNQLAKANHQPTFLLYPWLDCNAFFIDLLTDQFLSTTLGADFLSLLSIGYLVPESSFLIIRMELT